MDENIQNIKIELIQWLTTLNDDLIIQQMLVLRDNQEKNKHTQISEGEKKSIERGISDTADGKLKSHSEARKIYERWL